MFSGRDSIIKPYTFVAPFTNPNLNFRFRRFCKCGIVDFSFYLYILILLMDKNIHKLQNTFINDNYNRSYIYFTLIACVLSCVKTVIL